MDPQLAYLIEQGEGWVRDQRARHRQEARALHPHTQSALAPFCGAELLRAARFRSVPVIENPDFYDALIAAGQPLPMAFTTARGITFDDTVLLSAQDAIAQGAPSGLLFHELVHVVQYRLLGIGGFIHGYVTGWAAAGFVYEAIPLEREAFDLEQRFEREPQRHFSVRTLVSRRLALS